MAEPHVVSALVRKRAELAGEIENLQDRLRQAIIDLDAIDAAILIFDPSIELMAVKDRPVPAQHRAFRGEVSRIVLSTLREGTRPLTTAEVTAKVMEGRGLDPGNQRLAKVIQKRTAACLRDLRIRGTVRGEQGPERHMLWEIAR